MNTEEENVNLLKKGSSEEFFENIKAHYIVFAVIVIIIIIFFYYRNNFTNSSTDPTTASSLIPQPQVLSSNPYTSGADLRFGSVPTSTDQGSFTSGFNIVSY